MKAMVLTGHGGYDRLEYQEDWPTPEPGDGEVQIRVGACGLNNTDINTRTAWYSKAVTQGVTDTGAASGFETAEDADGSWGNSKISFPRIQGADVAGVIAAVGGGVSLERIGQRVMIDPWLLAAGNWMDTTRTLYFGSECDGGFAEFTVVRADNAIAVHSKLSDAELATFPCAYTTAENLISRTELKPGETVVISGASGGVGSAAIQLCKLRGARVIAVASSSKAEILQDLGADTVIDRNVEDLESAIKDNSERPIDVALDVVGSKMFMPLINVLRQGGRYSSSGAIAGPQVEFDLRQLIYKDLKLTGATIVPPGTMQRVVNLINQDHLQPLLAGTFPLQELAKAQQMFQQKTHVGNIVVTLGENG
jgi:NADPH:quinone reductase-like Zn-dependent oxidoreductase